MSKLQELQKILGHYQLFAKKGLGQNFLVDQQAIDKIVAAADLSASDNVVEVGPGTGFLTEQLVQKAGQVLSVELDRNMVGILQAKFKGARNFQIVNQDILKFDIRSLQLTANSSQLGYKVVANIPYYITSPLLKHFLQSENRPSLMVVLVQREVAEKVCGLTGKSLITIETQLFGEPEIVGIVKAASFYPAPKVDSAILRIKVYKKPALTRAELADFLRIVKFGFSQKRKKLHNTLAAGLHLKPSEVAETLKKAGIDPNLRPENLEIGDWKKITKAFSKLKS